MIPCDSCAHHLGRKGATSDEEVVRLHPDLSVA